MINHGEIGIHLRDVVHSTEAGMKLELVYIAACLSNYSIDKESFCD